MDISFHKVKAVSLSAEMLSNDSMRVIRIETSRGEICEIQLFGNTEDVKHLPLSSDYTDYDERKASREAVADAENAVEAQAAE